MSAVEQKNRVSNIFCLCWFASKEAKAPEGDDLTLCADIILEMVKFIEIRGGGAMRFMEIIGILEVLCNFALWQKFSYKEQLKLILEVRKLLLESLSYS